MSATSQAELFFNSIPKSSVRSFKFLEKLSQPAALTDENEWREFKEAKPLTHPSNAPIPEASRKEHDRRIKSIWSENIGAFANSGGGILIWGIKAPKKYAEGPSLAADAQALANRLQELANDAVDPPVLGVQVRAFPKSRVEKDGFVVCLIPPSKHAPHRSKFAEREFYIRAQDGNVNCQTAILRRMFYPVSSPNLIPAVNARAVVGADGSVHMAGSIQILNRGNFSADEIYATIYGSLSLHIDRGIWDQPGSHSNSYWCKRPIHPEQDLYLTQQFRTTGSYGSWPAAGTTQGFRIEIYARNAPPVCRSFAISWDDLRECAERKLPWLDYGEQDSD